jgi:glutamate mutase epsilon subunit
MVDPKMAEAISAIHAIQLGLAAGFSDVIVEGDTLPLIQDINMVSPLLNTTGHYLDSIKEATISTLFGKGGCSSFNLLIILGLRFLRSIYDL